MISDTPNSTNVNVDTIIVVRAITEQVPAYEAEILTPVVGDLAAALMQAGLRDCLSSTLEMLTRE